MDSNDFAQLALKLHNAAGAGKPPDEGLPSESHQIIPPAVVRDTRGYIEKIANQVNGAYERGWYDACAVMMRRLLETLVIEVFEHHKIAERIQNKDGDFLYLGDLISKLMSEKTWTLSRNTKNALPKLKNLGDKSAHSRRYIAYRHDLDAIQTLFRGTVQELVFLSNLK